MIRIFENIDCMEGMGKYADLLKSRKVLAIVDPPYGIGFDGEVPSMSLHTGNTSKSRKDRWKNPRLKGYVRKKWDKEKPDKVYFDELFRVSKNQIIWGGNHFGLPQSCGWIFWDKQIAEGFSLADGELAWTSFNKAVRKFEYLWAGFAKKEPIDRIHPTQKPIALYKWLLEKYSAGHNLILDTHVGSASSLIACEDFGIDYIGFELDEDYYKMANERLLKARFEREAKKSEVCVVNGLGLFEGVNE